MGQTGYEYLENLVCKAEIFKHCHQVAVPASLYWTWKKGKKKGTHTGFGFLSGKIPHTSLGTGPAHTVYAALNADKIFYLKFLHLATEF